MQKYEQNELDQMVSCAKTITDPPRRELIEDRGFQKNDMSLESVDGRYKFRAFIRISVDFVENFSIGLDLLDKDGSRLPLLRCNGAHEGVRENPNHPVGNHFGFHIHRTLSEDLDAERAPCRSVQKTEEYGSYQDALRYFVRRCQINDADRYFPGLWQQTMFPE